MQLVVAILALVLDATHAFYAGVAGRPRAPIYMQQGREADDVAGAVGNAFKDIFAGFAKSQADKQAEIDRAYAEQLEVAAMRKNPAARRKAFQEMEARRRQSSRQANDKIAWQRSTKQDPLVEFRKRKADNKIEKIGYEDVPKGGIQMPMASFGVGGEFGQGGKMDNGARFDLRLPYVDQGWVDDGSAAESLEEVVPFWENLLSGGKLQREAEARAKERAEKRKKKGLFW